VKDLDKMQKLIGNITEEDLKHVDCSVGDVLGIFVPSTGYCKYAVTPNHIHPSYMFNIFVVSGQQVIEPQISIPDNHFLSCVLSPDVPHQEENNEKFNRYYAVMIDKVYFEKIYYSYTQKEIPEFVWHQFVVDIDIVFYIKQFIYEYENGVENYNTVLLSFSDIITHKLVRSVLEREEYKDNLLCEYGIEKAEQYLQQNFGKKITIFQLAQIANMSVSHFDRIFKKDYGYTPFQYLLNIRIDKAKKYLKNRDQRIINIALSCGFSSASSFSSCFHKAVGMKPMEYRKAYETHYISAEI